MFSCINAKHRERRGTLVNLRYSAATVGLAGRRWVYRYVRQHTGKEREDTLTEISFGGLTPKKVLQTNNRKSAGVCAVCPRHEDGHPLELSIFDIPCPGTHPQTQTSSLITTFPTFSKFQHGPAGV